MKFLDFCAGIGGGRTGLTNNNLSCVGYSEIDKNAILTYNTMYGKNEENFGDLTKINPSALPDFDLLICGFPCQTFSIVGKREGFNDIRGMVIFSIAEILKQKNVSYFILENVKGLVNHNKGETINKIVTILSDIGYNVSYTVLNSIDYGIPHMRERVYFVGIKKEIDNGKFHWPIKVECSDISQYFDENNNTILSADDKTFQKYINNKYNYGKFDLQEILKTDNLVLDTRQSDLRLYKNKVPTLRTGRHGILYVKDGQLHKINGYEGLKLQGFSDEYIKKVRSAKINNNRLLSQAGNAMTVNVIESIGKELLKCVEV